MNPFFMPSKRGDAQSVWLVGQNLYVLAVSTVDMS